MAVTADPLLRAPGGRSLLTRVPSILLRPRAEWPVIDGEATVGSLYGGHIAPLAAIPPLAALIGTSVFGVRVPFGGTYHAPIGSAVTSAVMLFMVAGAVVSRVGGFPSLGLPGR